VELNLSPRCILAVLATAGAVLALVLAMTLGGASASAAVHRHAVHHARHHVAKNTSDPAGPANQDNVQSGDQTSPDNPASQTAGEGESSVESEHGQPGEPPNGHQDTGGNIDHQCDGNCVE
jgi:hypothetical protein